MANKVGDLMANKVGDFASPGSRAAGHPKSVRAQEMTAKLNRQGDVTSAQHAAASRVHTSAFIATRGLVGGEKVAQYHARIANQHANIAGKMASKAGILGPKRGPVKGGRTGAKGSGGGGG